MKKSLQSVLLCLMVLVLSNAKGFSQTTLIHYWNFNNFTTTFSSGVNPNLFTPIKADYSILDTNKAEIMYQIQAGTSSDYTTYLDQSTGDTINARMGADSGNCLRLRNPSDSMEARFYMPTTGYDSIVFTFEAQSSSVTNGCKNLVFDYSTDSGSTWKTTGMLINGTAGTTDSVIGVADTTDELAPTPFWNKAVIGFDSTVNNKNGFIVRMKFAGTTNVTTKGNDRFDNVTLDGKLIPPAAVATVTAENNNITLYPNPATTNININTPAASEKTIAIYNVAGQKVYSNTVNTQTVTVPVSALNTGLYYVVIHEATGASYTAKFVKQ